jgi:hypothetical protein
MRFLSTEDVVAAGNEVLIVTVELANRDEFVGKVRVEEESVQVMSGDDVAQLSATVPPNCCTKLDSDDPTDTVVVPELPEATVSTAFEVVKVKSPALIVMVNGVLVLGL